MNHRKILVPVLVLLSVTLQAQSNWEFGGEIIIEGLDSGSKLVKFDISPSGDFYAIEPLQNKLIRISESGRVKGFIGGFGWQEEQFDSPSDIWVTALDVFISDQNNHRIQRYDRELNFISALDGAVGFGAAEFEYPGGVAQSARGNLYLSDPYNSKVLKYSLDGNFLLEFGGAGYAEGTTVEPRSIGVTTNETVVIADAVRNILLYYDEFGNYLFSEGEGIIREPVALAIGSDNEVFLLDGGTGSILIFQENEGSYYEIKLFEIAEGLKFPADIAVKNSELFILDSQTNKITLFKKR